MVFKNKKINIHTHNFHSNEIEILNQYPNNFIDLNQFYSLGIHPWYIDNDKLTKEIDFIQSKKNDPNFLAIGECGLDKLIETNFDLQLYVFQQQIELAIQLKKPLIIHCVRSYQEVISVLKKYHLSIPIIFHGFNKNIILAKQLLQNQCFLSFGKDLLINKTLQNVFLEIPNDMFFLETDDADTKIETIYQKASEIKDISEKELIDIVNTNFFNVFVTNL